MQDSRIEKNAISEKRREEIKLENREKREGDKGRLN